jgi:glycosyltransferase involved in cell wall biosynthesis
MAFTLSLELKAAGIDFRVHVIGQQVRERPAVFDEILPLLRTEIIEWGTVLHADRYRRILRQCHAVISTALQDFQGLAILEAVACGCVPVVPDRLAYREDGLRLRQIYPICLCRISSHPISLR